MLVKSQSSNADVLHLKIYWRHDLSMATVTRFYLKQMVISNEINQRPPRMLLFISFIFKIVKTPPPIYIQLLKMEDAFFPLADVNPGHVFLGNSTSNIKWNEKEVVITLETSLLQNTLPISPPSEVDMSQQIFKIISNTI